MEEVARRNRFWCGGESELVRGAKGSLLARLLDRLSWIGEGKSFGGPSRRASLSVLKQEPKSSEMRCDRTSEAAKARWTFLEDSNSTTPPFLSQQCTPA